MHCYFGLTFTSASGNELGVWLLSQRIAVEVSLRALMSLVAQKTLLRMPTEVWRVCSRCETVLTYCGSRRNVTSCERCLVERGSRYTLSLCWAHYPIKPNAIYSVQWPCHARLRHSCAARSRDAFGSFTDQDYCNITEW
jgi:hypothetical protein